MSEYWQVSFASVANALELDVEMPPSAGTRAALRCKGEARTEVKQEPKGMEDAVEEAKQDLDTIYDPEEVSYQVVDL